MELSGVQWSKIQDMCQVLQCFEECTRLVSADNAIISMSIPLMRLLMQSLTHIKDQASAPEEEESLDDSQRLSGQGSVHDEVPGEEEVEDEEDDGDEYIFNEEAFPGAREIGGVARPGSGFLRDTSDVDLPATAPQPSTTADLTTGTLAHMADYALRILKRDTRITKMMNDDDYWLACLLDPRYKGKLQNIMPHENLELILATKQSTLVDRLLLAFPAHSARDRSHTSSRGQQTREIEDFTSLEMCAHSNEMNSKMANERREAGRQITSDGEDARATYLALAPESALSLYPSTTQGRALSSIMATIWFPVSTHKETTIVTFGYSLYAGWIGAAFCLFGGIVIVCCSGESQAFMENRFYYSSQGSGSPTHAKSANV
ncbi:unnamed protein product [Ranitomeya imitator]|uniref:Uncharacterized protein n=1 Tax=Ranitomeya imitator TaxID=111125 RepID=A0ABN9L431_9NEOB|nr:unnamed protein product [Ranitomeya imitator]